MAAAEKDIHQGFCEEATCSICQDYFKDPVIIPECGHNFCQACLDQCWGNSDSEVSCPQCRLPAEQRMVTSNRPLGNLIEIAKKSLLRGQKRARDERGLCDRHQEPQKLFCQDDKVLICMVCDKSKGHRNHQVIPLEEAFGDCKDQITTCLKTLREKKEKRALAKTNTEKESQDLLEQLTTEKEKSVKTFKQLHQFLEEQEKLLLTRLEWVMEDIEREKQNHLDKLKKERESLENIIGEMEKKLRQPAVDLLQGIENFMERFKIQNNCDDSAVIFPAALKWKIWDFDDINIFLEGIAKQLEDSLLSGLQLQKANVYFDPETAYEYLKVSEDCKTVNSTDDDQDVSDNPERFDEWSAVLGCEEFTAGRHFWEVTIGASEGWAVGVARKEVKRKGENVKDAGGLWYVEKWKDEYWSINNNCENTLSLSERPKKIRVVLNCEGGRVAFYDAYKGTLICALSEISFTRETLRPFCFLDGTGYLALSS